MIEKDPIKIINSMSHLMFYPKKVENAKHKIESLPLVKGLKFRQSSVSEEYSIGKLNGYIVDFEGDIFMAGFLLDNQVYQFYILEQHDSLLLYKHTLEIFKILLHEEFIGFSFSEFEAEQLRKMKITISKDYEGVISKMFILNLQESRFESLTEASLQLGLRNTGDILNRDSKSIVNFYRCKLIEPILLHNQNCLSIEALLLKNRFMKNYKI